MHLCNILLHNVHICTYFTFLISVVVYFIKLYTIRLINAIYLFQIEVKLNNHITKYAQSY